MRSRNATQSITKTIDAGPTTQFQVEIHYWYEPPEDPGGFGKYRVGAGVEFQKIEVLKVITTTTIYHRRGLHNAHSLDEAANEWLEDNRDAIIEEICDRHS